EDEVGRLQVRRSAEEWVDPEEVFTEDEVELELGDGPTADTSLDDDDEVTDAGTRPLRARQSLQLSLDASTHAKLEAVAQEARLSVPALAREIVSDWLKYR